MATTDVVATVVLVKLVTLALTLVLTHLTFQAYRQSGQREIRALSAGFGCMSVGILLGGVVYQLLQVDVMIGLLVEAVCSAIGLGLIVYSLYGYR